LCRSVSLDSQQRREEAVLISRARNGISLVWLGLGLFLVLTALFLALPFGTVEVTGALYLGLLGISMLATGSLIRWESTRRWLRLLAVGAGLAAAAFSVAQAIRAWPQPLSAANVALLLTSILVLVLAWFCIVYFAHAKPQAMQRPPSESQTNQSPSS
jgi:hypothetical protein